MQSILEPSKGVVSSMWRPLKMDNSARFFYLRPEVWLFPFCLWIWQGLLHCFHPKFSDTLFLIFSYFSKFNWIQLYHFKTQRCPWPPVPLLCLECNLFRVNITAHFISNHTFQLNISPGTVLIVSPWDWRFIVSVRIPSVAAGKQEPMGPVQVTCLTCSGIGNRQHIPKSWWVFP